MKMAASCTCTHVMINVAFLLLIVITQVALMPHVVESRTLKHTKAQQPFKSLLDLEGLSKGQSAKGIPELRRYLNRFGYLYLDDADSSSVESEEFDEMLESAVKRYQTFFRFNITGKLDSRTLQEMSEPRCGVPDMFVGPPPLAKTNIITDDNNDDDDDKEFIHLHSDYTFFKGLPKWKERQLYYKIEHGAVTFNYSDEEFEMALEDAAAQWSDNSVFTLDHALPGAPAEIVAGLHDGNHFDGLPFDGKRGVLAHAFAPTDGRMHFDAAENWSNKEDLDDNHFHMESVMLHELGHILGLGHSNDPLAVMYPTMESGFVKNLLETDDLEAIAYLYPWT